MLKKLFKAKPCTRCAPDESCWQEIIYAQFTGTLNPNSILITDIAPGLEFRIVEINDKKAH